MTKERIAQSVSSSRRVRAILRAHDRLRPLLLADTYDALFSQLDTDGDGFVSFDEFRLFCREAQRPADPEAALTEVLATASNDAMLRLLFTFLDNGGGGDITKESLSGSVRRSREVRSILRTHEFLPVIAFFAHK